MRSHRQGRPHPSRSVIRLLPVLGSLILLAGPALPGAASGALLAQDEPEVIRLPQEPARAGPASPAVAPAPVPSGNIQEILSELWLRRKEFLEKGDSISAERTVQMMRDVVQREGLLGSDEIAGAFLTDGTRALESGNTQRALQSFALAREFAPDRPEALFAVAKTLWVEERDFGGASTALFQGLRVALTHPSSRVTLLGNMALILLAGGVITAVLWCLLTALRTARLVQHDLYEARVRRLSEGPAQVAAWAIWLLPALFWFTGWWILVYWLALGVMYLKGSERVISLAVCACLLIALPSADWITRASSVTTEPSLRYLLDAARGNADPERIPILEEMTEVHSREPVIRFLLAQTYQRIGSSEAALQEYRQIQAEHPREARAWINSGNIFFAAGQFEQAAQEYRKAIETDPNSALAYFNLHIARQETLHLDEADAAFRKARELDNGLVTTILTSSGGQGRREPVDARARPAEVLEAIRKGTPVAGKSADWWEWLDPLPLAGGLGFLGCLVFSWAGPRRGMGRAQRCTKCGQAFCRRCQVGMRREEGYCTPCRHLYVLRDPVPPAIREERERMVAAHERWQWISRRLVSLVLPGAGQVQGGRTFLGMILLGGVATALSALLLSGRLLAYVQVAPGAGTGALRVAAVAGIAACWLAGNVLSFERRG